MLINEIAPKDPDISSLWFLLRKAETHTGKKKSEFLTNSTGQTEWEHVENTNRSILITLNKTQLLRIKDLIRIDTLKLIEEKVDNSFKCIGF